MTTPTRFHSAAALAALLASISLVSCGGDASAATVDSHAGHNHPAPDPIAAVDAHAENELEIHSEDIHAGEADAHAGDAAPVVDLHEGENLVEIDPQDRLTIGLQTVIAETGSIDQRLTLPGVVAVRTDRLAHITAPVTSQVQSALVQLEDDVVAGQVLAQLRSTAVGQARLDYYDSLQSAQLAQINHGRAQRVREAALHLLELLNDERTADSVQRAMDGRIAGTAQGEMIEAYASWLSARVTLDRASEAAERGVGSELEQVAAQRDLEAAEARYRAMADELRFTTERDLIEADASQRAADTRTLIAERHLHMVGLSETEILTIRQAAESDGECLPDEEDIAEYSLSAPIGGRVISLHLTRGEWIEPEDALVTVVDLSEVWITARLFERDLQSFMVHQPDTAIVSVQAYPGEQFPATLVRVGSTLDPETRTIEVVYAIDNSDLRLRPEMFATVITDLSADNSTLVIPTSAIQRPNGETVVFVEEETNAFEMRDVRLGQQTEEWVEVIAGLGAGESVVVEGAFRLRSEMERGGFGDGHAH